MSHRVAGGSRAITAAAALLALSPLLPGCRSASGQRLLSFFFDGVPAPHPALAAMPGATPAAAPLPARRAGFGVHGPYAAKLCSACHASASSGALVAPREALCQRCHELQQGKRYLHGPLASGGCTVCHDPHSSQYRYSLVAESSTFCYSCHDPAAVARSNGHAATQAECTSCHDAHMSDRKFLLR